MPKVSIIIPVYNAQNYLKRCLDSVCNQTLKDIEIICINDCSTDNSLKILKEYANKDQRIQIINCTQNRGESVARNAGLNIAVGEYLGFVDNDDTIDLDFYEKLYTIAKSNNSDIVKGNCCYITNSIKIVPDDNKIIQTTQNKMRFTTHWWTAIYRHSIIEKHKIRFREDLILGGDIIFLNEMLLASDTFNITDNSFYYHYEGTHNTDTNILTDEKMNSAIHSYRIILNILIEAYLKNYNKSFIDAIFYYFLAIYYHITRSKSQASKELCVETLYNIYNQISSNIPEINIKLWDKNPRLLYLLITNRKNDLLHTTDGDYTCPLLKNLSFKHKIKILQKVDYDKL